MVSRRNLLAGSVIGTGAVLSIRPANALTFEDVPATSGVGLSLSNRCGGAAEHVKITADLRARLSAQGAGSGTSATATCPICGCPVTVYAGG